MRILFIASMLLISIHPAIAADKRGYSAGHFQLDIAGKGEGMVAPIDSQGGQALGVIAPIDSQSGAALPASAATAVGRPNTGMGAVQARPGFIQRPGLQRSNNQGSGVGNKSEQTTQSSNNKDTK